MCSPAKPPCVHKADALPIFIITARHWSVGALVALVAACGSPPARISPMLETAINYNLQGKQSFEDQDYQKALLSYHKALQIDRSIENAEGIALNLHNIAQIHLLLDKPDAAQSTLDEICENAAGLFQPEQQAQAALQKALALVSAAQPSQAQTWINKAEDFCGTACKPRGLILNVSARLALDRHQPELAIALASRALSLHQKALLLSEIANSQRLLGEALLEQQLPQLALPHLQEALQLDKNLGFPARISLDLTLLGMAHQHEQAKAFYRRALAVSQAANDAPGIRRANRALEALTVP